LPVEVDPEGDYLVFVRVWPRGDAGVYDFYLDGACVMPEHDLYSAHHQLTDLKLGQVHRLSKRKHNIKAVSRGANVQASGDNLIIDAVFLEPMSVSRPAPCSGSESAHSRGRDNEMKQQEKREMDITTNNGYLAPKRLQYNGYVFIGDVLECPEEVRELREFTNLIGVVSAEHSLRSKYAKAPEGERDEVVKTYLEKEGERIRFLDSLGFTIGWPLPLADLVEKMDLEAFRKELRIIERLMPEMSMVDLVYILDEPNFRDVPTETLEAFVDAFKEVFPQPKVWFCYAIVHPKFLDTVPPRNADVLGIDPYMFSKHYEDTPADFEYFYRESLACALEWVNRQDKPFMIAGDCFFSGDPEGKKAPRPETTRWYYELAMTQPNCIGLIWFYYGNVPIKSENLKGFNLNDAPEALVKVHRDIGMAMFQEPTPVGLQWESFGPAPELE
jgi:hypothetical protein